MQKTNYVLRLENIELDLLNRELRIGRQLLDVTLHQFANLAILILHANQPVSIDKLYQLARGDVTGRLHDYSNTVCSQISRINQKLGLKALIKSPRHFPGCKVIQGNSPENQECQTSLNYGDLSLDLISLRGSRRDVGFYLTHKEAKILVSLVLGEGEIVADEQLYEKLNDPSPHLTNVLSVLTCRINSKTGQPPLITRVKGEGYKLKAPTQTASHSTLRTTTEPESTPAQRPPTFQIGGQHLEVTLDSTQGPTFT